MSQLTLRFSVVEKNERGQEVELVRKALQFKPQVRNSSYVSTNSRGIIAHFVKQADPNVWAN